MARAERGHTLLETLTVVALMITLAGLVLPWLSAYLGEARLLGAGQQFRTEFRLAR